MGKSGAGSEVRRQELCDDPDADSGSEADMRVPLMEMSFRSGGGAFPLFVSAFRIEELNDIFVSVGH